MKLSNRSVAFLASEEGLVLEAYKDSVGVWTWALGITNSSGHEVYPRYKDKPQTVKKCLDVSLWLMEKKYLPAVLKAFPNANEDQLTAALSFHWNTGAIGRLNGDFSNAMKYVNAGGKKGLLLPRRKREEALWHGEWPKDLLVPIFRVKKPSYTPVGTGQLIDVTPFL